MLQIELNPHDCVYIHVTFSDPWKEHKQSSRTSAIIHSKPFNKKGFLGLFTKLKFTTTTSLTQTPERMIYRLAMIPFESELHPRWICATGAGQDMLNGTDFIYSPLALSSHWAAQNGLHGHSVHCVLCVKSWSFIDEVITYKFCQCFHKSILC